MKFYIFAYYLFLFTELVCQPPKKCVCECVCGMSLCVSLCVHECVCVCMCGMN